MVTKTIDQYGTIRYRNEKNQYHREDGPAVEYSGGTKWWYINSLLHRTDGPAIEYPDGSKFWCINDLYHRTDGPAKEWADGEIYYFINGTHISYEHWLAIKDFPLLW